MQDLRVTSVQNVLHWENEQANLSMFEEQLAQLSGKTDLIVLPEMFSSGFSMEPKSIAKDFDGDCVCWMQAQAKRLNSAICGSIAVKEAEAFANRFVFVHPNGNIDYYDKRHCFRMSGEHLVYKAGDQRKIINYLGWRILPQVCYDLRFPVFSRNKDDYDLAIYVANWPKVRRKPWMTLLQARAIENLSYCVGVNRVGFDGNNIEYSGDSLQVDFKGDVIFDHQQAVGVSTQVLSLASLNSFREKFPAWKDCDDFELMSN